MASVKKTGRKPQKQAPEGQDLLITELREIHSAESQLARALPRLTKAVESEAARGLMENRLERGERLIEDLETALEEMESSPGRKKNIVAEGLVTEAREHMQEIEAGPALDAVLAGAMLKTEHYCMGAWEVAKSLADAVDEKFVVEIMKRELDAGKAMDKELKRLGEKEINPALLAFAASEAASAQNGGGRGATA